MRRCSDAGTLALRAAASLSEQLFIARASVRTHVSGKRGRVDRVIAKRSHARSIGTGCNFA